MYTESKNFHVKHNLNLYNRQHSKNQLTTGMVYNTKMEYTKINPTINTQIQLYIKINMLVSQALLEPQSQHCAISCEQVPYDYFI